ncbi:MAG: hypothetical protein IBX56_12390 [Methylomicrobium sp.]|nr:hypothetical protein [Methylomicrobium sp.]
MSYNKMTIKDGAVYRLKAGQTGAATDMGSCKRYWFLPYYATKRFKGSINDCLRFISANGGEYVALEDAKLK